MSIRRILPCAMVLALALLIAMPAHPIGEIYLDTDTFGTFNEQLEAWRTGDNDDNEADNDILVEGVTGEESVYLVDETITVIDEADDPDLGWPNGMLIISGDPDNYPYEVVLSGTGEKTPTIWSFPMISTDDGDEMGCARVEMRVVRDPADDTVITDFEVTIVVSYLFDTFSGTIDTFEIRDENGDPYDTYSDDDEGTGFASPFTIVRTLDPVVDAAEIEDWLRENGNIELLLSDDSGEELTGEVEEGNFCAVEPKPTVWTFPLVNGVPEDKGCATVTMRVSRDPDNAETITSFHVSVVVVFDAGAFTGTVTAFDIYNENGVSYKTYFDSEVTFTSPFIIDRTLDPVTDADEIADWLREDDGFIELSLSDTLSEAISGEVRPGNSCSSAPDPIVRSFPMTNTADEIKGCAITEMVVERDPDDDTIITSFEVTTTVSFESDTFSGTIDAFDVSNDAGLSYRTYDDTEVTFTSPFTVVRTLDPVADAAEIEDWLREDGFIELSLSDDSGGEITGEVEVGDFCTTLATTTTASFPLANATESKACVQTEILIQRDPSDPIVVSNVEVTMTVTYESDAFTGTVSAFDIFDELGVSYRTYTTSDVTFTSPFTIVRSLDPVADADEIADWLREDGGYIQLSLADDLGEAIVGEAEEGANCTGTGEPIVPPSTMFQVENGGTLVLDNITIAAEDVGIDVYPGGRIELNRVYFRDSGRIAIRFMPDLDGLLATGTMTNCVIVRSGSDGIVIDGGDVTIQQCSFLDNEQAAIYIGPDAADARITVSASLFHNNDVGIFGAPDPDPDPADHDDTDDDVDTDPIVDACWFIAHSTADYTADIAAVITNEFETTDLPTGLLLDDEAIDTTVNYFDDNFWRGRIVDFLLYAPIALDKEADPDDPPVLTVAALPLENGEDFEGSPRSIAEDAIVIIGADIPFGGIISASGIWVDCDIITPRNTINGRAVAASGDPILIRLEVAGIPLEGAELWLEYEKGDFAVGNALLLSDNLAIATTITDRMGSTNYNVPLDEPGLYDGLAQLILVTQLGEAYGFDLTYEDGYLTDAAEVGRFFIIDTSPPIATECAFETLLDSNDASMASGTFPADWAGDKRPVPKSDGSMVDLELDPQYFFNVNAAAGSTLSFTMNVCFIDQGIGFATDLPYVSAVGGPAIVEALTNPFGISDEAAPKIGTVWWDPGDPSLETILLPQPDTASLVISSTYIEVDGYPGINMTYTFSGLEYTTNNWHLISRFVVVDAVGNRGKAERRAHFWWFPNDLWSDGAAGTGLIFTADPGGSATSDPVITWDIDRPAAPEDAYPAYPMARFQLIRIDGTLQSNLLGGFTPWLQEHTIDRYTVVSAGATPIRLGTILDRPENINKTIFLVIQGADEAGNISPYPDETTSWINEGQGASLETSIAPRYWHNSTLNGDFYTIDPQIGDIDFGSSARVPLPTNGEFRVEAAFDVTAGAVGTESGDLFIAWELFENGVLVASGTMQPNRNKRATLTVPQDLLNPPDNIALTIDQPFLNSAPTGFTGEDRLGDEGDPPTNRQRDVEYTFTARTVLQTLNKTIRDSSPSSVSFTVYADREVGATDPVKVFVRE